MILTDIKPWGSFGIQASNAAEARVFFAETLFTNNRYNLKDMTWQTIVDTVVVGAMGPPGGGRNHITPRLLRHFNILCFLEFDDSTLTRIFKTIVDWHFGLNKVRSRYNDAALCNQGVVVMLGHPCVCCSSRCDMPFCLAQVSVLLYSVRTNVKKDTRLGASPLVAKGNGTALMFSPNKHPFDTQKYKDTCPATLFSALPHKLFTRRTSRGFQPALTAVA